MQLKAQGKSQLLCQPMTAIKENTTLKCFYHLNYIFAIVYSTGSGTEQAIKCCDVPAH